MKHRQPVFNGATGFRLWSPLIGLNNWPDSRQASMEPQGLGCGVAQHIPARILEAGASMEPQGLGCGVARNAAHQAQDSQLQWSHRV